MKNKTINKIEKVLDMAESELKILKNKNFRIRNLLINWKKINPYEVSDTQNRVNILTGKEPLNRIFTYHDEFTSQYFELTKKIDNAYSKILRETKEVEPRENENFMRALKYKTKFYERGMTAKNLEYLEKTSVEKIVEDIKEGKIESEINKLEKKLK